MLQCMQSLAVKAQVMHTLQTEIKTKENSPDFLASWTARFRSSFRRPPYLSFHSSRFLLMVLRVSSTLEAVSLASVAAALAFWISSFVSSGKTGGKSLRWPEEKKKQSWLTAWT